jgi:hypothetical protein
VGNRGTTLTIERRPPGAGEASRAENSGREVRAFSLLWPPGLEMGLSSFELDPTKHMNPRPAKASGIHPLLSGLLLVE